MALKQRVTDKINQIATLEEALPFLQVLSIDVIKVFLLSSAKYGFFDALNENVGNEIKFKNASTQTEAQTEPIQSEMPLVHLDEMKKSEEYSFKRNKTNRRVFDVLQSGSTLKGTLKKDYKYANNHWKNNLTLHQFGTIIFGTFFKHPTKISLQIKIIKNCVNNSIGFGFITMKFNQFVNETPNEGNNHSVILYGDGRYYTSHEYVNDSYENGSVLLPFVNYFKNGDIIAIEMDMKNQKNAQGKIYNIKHTDDASKHFIVSLKTTNNAIAVCANIKFKPMISVIKQTFD